MEKSKIQSFDWDAYDKANQVIYAVMKDFDESTALVHMTTNLLEALIVFHDTVKTSNYNETIYIVEQKQGKSPERIGLFSNQD
jgi:hypothetical protein